MKKALIVGGSNGIGMAIAHRLKGYDRVYIIDKVEPDLPMLPHMEYEKFDLTTPDYSIFDRYQDVSLLMITAGFGSIAHFDDISEQQIIDMFQVNAVATIRIVKHFYKRLSSKDDFKCGLMGSIAGFMSSPLLAVYGATKAALKIFVESVNVELEMSGTSNRILNVSPGSIAGTRFNGGSNHIDQLVTLADEIIARLEAKKDLFIPKYEEVYRHVLARYQTDFRAEGRHSYEYKMKSGRMKST